MKKHLKEFCLDNRILFISSACLFYILCMSLTSSLSSAWRYVGCGVVFFFLFEYLIHRFILHGFIKFFMKKAYMEHELHHVDPTDIRYLLTPNSYNVPIHIFLLFLFSFIFKNFHLGSAFMTGVALYHLYYEWIHFVSHRPITLRTKWARNMKKFHLLHHYKSPELWYGVTHPFVDVLFMTSPDEKTIKKKDS